MKKTLVYLFMGVMVLGTSCKKYLDINQNPNQATSATPPLILPQALTATANNLNGFNSYGAQLVGYMANAGGYGGFGTSISYNFSANDFSARWTSTYDNLEDYQAILNQTKDDPKWSYFDAVARIMKAHSFQLLVDTYNDVPYTEALKGADNLSPAYTDAKVIYKDLADELDKAIAAINTGNNTLGVTPLGSSDVMFGGDVTKWKKFANTLKLRILIHGNGKVTFTNTTFSDDGFLTDDAQINPGFARDNGRQNPKWNTWAYSYTGSDANKAWMPNMFVMSFYTSKLNDSRRGGAIYYKFPSTGTNRLGVESNNIQSSPSGSFWYPAVIRKGASAGDTTGVLKGPDAPMPVITAAESYFLQAEASVRNLFPGVGDAKTLFENGIKASFTYLHKLPNGSFPANVTADTITKYVNKYLADNATKPLVNFDLATTLDQKIEAIITQKYIALNMVNSEEAWNEYRRTHYPTISNSVSATGTQTFASSVSESTAPDRLPTRILYPTSEGSYNTKNVPKGISPFTSKIFWAL